MFLINWGFLVVVSLYGRKLEVLGSSIACQKFLLIILVSITVNNSFSNVMIVAVEFF